MNFYENFVRLCTQHGISPSKVAREIGISKSAVTRWKDGGGMTDPVAIRIADYFGVSVDVLRNGDKNEQKEKTASFVANGLNATRYDELTPENRAVIDSLIEKLLKSQSVE